MFAALAFDVIVGFVISNIFGNLHLTGDMFDKHLLSSGTASGIYGEGECVTRMTTRFCSTHRSTSRTDAHVQRIQQLQRMLTLIQRGMFSNTTLDSAVALLCNALPCFAVLCFALHCFALHCLSLHCFTLLCIALHCFASLCIALQLLYVALLCLALRCFACCCSFALRCIALRCFALLTVSGVLDGKGKRCHM
jgi:hypothetical protein